MKLNRKQSIIESLRIAQNALYDLLEAWDYNTEGIDLNEVDSALEFYPFNRDFAEIVNDFDNWADEIEEAVENMKGHNS